MKKAYNSKNKKLVNIDKWLNNNNISISKCTDNPNNRCLCCQAIDCSPVFVSNVTGKQFILPTGTFNCKSNNIIYLITCSDCGIQYVGQTSQPLHIRLNAHRSCALRNSSTFLYQHFNGTDHKFENATIQIIDWLDVDDASSDLDQIENFWISTLCTAYPLGLNDRLDGTGNVSKQKSDCSKIYFCSPITRRRRGHGRRKKEKRQDNILRNHLLHHDNIIVNNIVEELANLFHIDTAFFYVRLRSLYKKLLQSIVLKSVADNISIKPILQSFLYNTFRSDTPTVKEVKREHIIFPFTSKFIDQLHLNSILRDTSITSLLPKEFNDKLPLRIFYKFNIPIGRKVLNYNTFLKQLSKDDMHMHMLLQVTSILLPTANFGNSCPSELSFVNQSAKSRPS